MKFDKLVEAYMQVVEGDQTNPFVEIDQWLKNTFKNAKFPDGSSVISSDLPSTISVTQKYKRPQYTPGISSDLFWGHNYVFYPEENVFVYYGAGVKQKLKTSEDVKKNIQAAVQHLIQMSPEEYNEELYHL